MAAGSVLQQIFQTDNVSKDVIYKPNDNVKIIRFCERFWCKVIDVKFGTIIAEVDNVVLNGFLEYGDIICFQPDEVIASYSIDH